MSDAEHTLLMLFIGATLGMCAGVCTAALLASAKVTGQASRADLLAAYLMGYSDAERGAPADTTRPATLGD